MVYANERKTTATNAKITPIVPMMFSFSPKINNPIKTVAAKLKTDQIVPTRNN